MNADEAHQNELEHREKEEMTSSNTSLGDFKGALERTIKAVIDIYDVETYEDIDRLSSEAHRKKLAKKLTKHIFITLVKLNVRGVAK